jgi:hypothetical protein
MKKSWFVIKEGKVSPVPASWQGWSIVIVYLLTMAAIVRTMFMFRESPGLVIALLVLGFFTTFALLWLIGQRIDKA